MSVLILSSRACLGHDMGDGHPESPQRLRVVLEALEAQEFSMLPRAEAPAATRVQLSRVHSVDYVDTILALRPLDGAHIRLDGDTLVGAGSTAAMLHAAGAGVAAVDAVCGGDIRRAFCAVRPPGHHAEPALAMGFCFFSSAAVAVRHAQVIHGIERVAILDFDVHHGNGTQAVFLDDPTVFFASTHQTPLFPGTGAAEETGIGNLVNVPLSAGTGGKTFREAWSDVILPAMEHFAPGLVIVSAGFDAHVRDPLAQLRLTEEDFFWVTEAICHAARRCCSGRVVSMLEGGYDLTALARSAAAHVRALRDA